jgi:phage baseplate assembly protein gpV
MRKILALVSVSLLAGAVFASAAQSPKSASSAKPAAATAPKAKASKPATHTVSGTLESYDAAGKTLTVKGTKSTWTFSAGDARAWEGSKSIGLDELASHTGAKVTVKYTDEGGQKSATSVRLAAAHTAKASSKSK